MMRFGRVVLNRGVFDIPYLTFEISVKILDITSRRKSRAVLILDHMTSSMTSQESLECLMTSQECLVTSEKNGWNVT